MIDFAAPLGRLVADAVRGLAPIVAVIVFFQFIVLGQPFPNLGAALMGLLAVVMGLSLLLKGLEMALFPMGEALAEAFARKGSLMWLLFFAFCLGFGTTVAEPALIAICNEAARVMADAQVIPDSPASRASYASMLRYTVALAVGLALIVGVFRILKGWPVHWLIIGGYAIVVGLTSVAPPEIIGIAYDSGGVTTSTVTVPLVAALGIGLAGVIGRRNAMTDGFGLIAFASLTPIIFVLLFGMIV